MSSRPPITESPWFWACLFASVGLLALWAAGPKYGQRQLIEENKGQGRMRAAEQQSGGDIQTPVSREGELAISLHPLYAVLGGVLVIAWGMLWWRHIRPMAEKSSETSPESPPDR